MRSPADRYLNRVLKYGKKSKLRMTEKISLGWRGVRDGYFGLPKENGDGEWTSPSVQREINACNETHHRIYGTLQIRLEGKCREAVRLADALRRDEVLGKALKEDMPRELTEEEKYERKYGEERLADSQICSRRLKEYERKKEKVRIRVEQLAKKAEAEYEELIKLKSYLLQKQEEAAIVCRRIRSHTQQRIDYYWIAASYAAGKKQRSIPAVFGQLPVSDAAGFYEERHREERRKMEQVINQYNGNKEAVSYERI